MDMSRKVNSQSKDKKKGFYKYNEHKKRPNAMAFQMTLNSQMKGIPNGINKKLTT